MKRHSIGVLLVVLAVTSAAIAQTPPAVPTGTIVAFAGKPTNVPRGWLLCDGRSVSRTTFPRLFAVIGTIYGDDGVTKFRLPDLRGRVVVGVGNSPNLTARALGETGGAETHTLTPAEMPSHTHPQLFDDDDGAAGGNNPDAHGGQRQLGTTGPTGGGQPHNNMQPFFVLTYIIKT